MRRLFTEALHTAAPTIQEIAQDMGCSTAALRAYRLGTRAPSSPVAIALAKALRRQSKQLERLAAHLERAAQRQEGIRGKA